MKIACKERPILFSGPMVQAILNGRKTQTRRIIKPPYAPSFPCKYGTVGDRLWVRETFCSSRNNTFYRADYPAFEKPNELSDSWDWDQGSGERWTPSIHMKRCYSRLTLEVTGVKVERLHDISNEEIIAEGFEATSDPKSMPDGSVAQVGRFEGRISTLRQLFSMKWDEINGAGAWAANPWVWVVSFRKLESEASHGA